MIQRWIRAGFLFFLITFLVIALNYDDAAWQAWNMKYESLLYNFLGDDWVPLFTFITYLGSAYVIFPLAGLFLIFLIRSNHQRMGALLATNIIGGRALTILLKALFHRPRPDVEHLVYAGFYGFPSGHAMHAVAFYGFTFIMVCLFNRKKPERTVSTATAVCLLIFLIGLSRVYLGVHYPLDVIGGYTAGAAWLCLLLISFRFPTAFGDRAQKKSAFLSGDGFH
ncbi:MAG TPA: phosphatase PAP2 family protein [Bacillales bacterium]|nr:phosphatase PAP2 family protein [Bacillales bacterium]